MNTNQKNTNSTERKSTDRRQRRASAEAFIQNVSGQSFPNSKKLYIAGKTHDIKVGMRQIAVTDTFVSGTNENPVLEPNEPINVYDTSGAYTDPNIEIDIYKGLPQLRKSWIEGRGDTETLNSVTSIFTQERLANEGLDQIRFERLPTVKCALAGKNVTQMHYARQGIITPEMEYIAIRENMQRAELRDESLTQQHA
ncbi:MAG: phosphomethylpyrimidine synthase ThiC, partial [Thiomicrorhabdus sp.]|nr:phosphomethylpyrimidine synthase ThiC [Thiomicrorhabdus sp.]